MLMYELKSFIAIYIILATISSFFRFNQNEIDILNSRKKCNRLKFLLFQNNDLKKIDFRNFNLKSSMQLSIAYIHKNTIFFPPKITQSDSHKKVLYEYIFFFSFNLTLLLRFK
jgi:hypothetical protein